MAYITDLNTLTRHCGFYTNDTLVNNGYGCKHKDCEDKVLMKKHKGYLVYTSKSEKQIVVQSFTKRNIRCNRRLVKKFIKKYNSLSDEEISVIVENSGYKYEGRCFSFSCPIATEADYQHLIDGDFKEDYPDIKTQQDMPVGWGDDLMIMSKETARDINLI